MPIVTMRELLEAGAHFGHRKSAWNPKMKPYIYIQRNQMHILDLSRTVREIEAAYHFVKNLVMNGGKILFVGTKQQAKKCIEQEAKRCGALYVNSKWLGGFLTNFSTIKGRLQKMRELEIEESQGLWDNLPKKEEMHLRKQLEKLRRNLTGTKDLNSLPQAIFVTDIKVEEIAVKEARKLNIPVVGIIDSNCDPDLVDYPIPANDDAIKSISLISSKIAHAVFEGKQIREKKQQEAEQAQAKKEEVSKELKEEIDKKQQVKQQVKQEVKQEVKEQVKQEVKEEVKEQVKQEVKEEDKEKQGKTIREVKGKRIRGEKIKQEIIVEKTKKKEEKTKEKIKEESGEGTEKETKIEEVKSKGTVRKKKLSNEES